MEVKAGVSSGRRLLLKWSNGKSKWEKTLKKNIDIYICITKRERERERCLIIVGGLLSDVSLSGVSFG